MQVVTARSPSVKVILEHLSKFSPTDCVPLDSFCRRVTESGTELVLAQVKACVALPGMPDSPLRREKPSYTPTNGARGVALFHPGTASPGRFHTRFSPVRQERDVTAAWIRLAPSDAVWGGGDWA